MQEQMTRDRVIVERLETLLDQARQESINAQATNQELQNEISRLKQKVSELQSKLCASHYITFVFYLYIIFHAYIFFYRSSESAELRQYQNQAAEYSKQISELRRQVTNERFDRARKEEQSRRYFIVVTKDTHVYLFSFIRASYIEFCLPWLFPNLEILKSLFKKNRSLIALSFPDRMINPPVTRVSPPRAGRISVTIIAFETTIDQCQLWIRQANRLVEETVYRDSQTYHLCARTRSGGWIDESRRTIHVVLTWLSMFLPQKTHSFRRLRSMSQQVLVATQGRRRHG